MLPAYPAGKFPVYVGIAAGEVFGHLSEAAAFSEVGVSLFCGFMHTLLGKAMGVMMRAVGVQRSLQRMTRIFRNGGNYIETSATEVEPKVVDLWFNEVHGHPEFLFGLLREAATFLGPRAEIEILRREVAGATFRVRWDLPA